MPNLEVPSPLARRFRKAGIPLVFSVVFAGSYAAISAAPQSLVAMYAVQALLFIAVIYFVGVGADWMVDAACNIADRLGLSQLIIGLTVVAFGTSAPEGAVAMVAGFQGNGDITIANVVGSNIFNICFILGGLALLSKTGLPVRPEITRRDVPMLLLATVLIFLFVGGIPSFIAETEGGFGFPGMRLFNLRLEAGEGLFLLAVLVIYLVCLYRARREDAHSTQDTYHWNEETRLPQPAAASLPEDDAPPEAAVPEAAAVPKQEGAPGIFRDGLVFLVGLLLVVEGCDLLVGHAELVDGVYEGLGAIWFAKNLGVSDYVIGVTIVAAGTSTPELVVSFVAALRGRFDLTIGNLIGSDLFNMLGVVGLAGIILQQPLAPPVAVSPAVIGSLLALTALVGVTWVFMRTGHRLARWEGAVLLLIGISRWTMDFITQ